MTIDAMMACRLARTFSHTVSAFRPLADGSEETLCEQAQCALSRSAHLTSPAPPALSDAVPESRYALALYIRPELRFAIGDRLEISDGVRVWHATASDSFLYPSHCVTVVSISRVAEMEDGD